MFSVFFSPRPSAAPPRQTPPPKFDEVYQLLRNNLDGVSQADLDRAAVKGLLDRIAGAGHAGRNRERRGARVRLRAPLSKVAVYRRLLRLFPRRHGRRPPRRKSARRLSGLAQTNKSKIKGVILDLRFAVGHDYAAAAAAADCFLNSDQPLLDWGSGFGQRHEENQRHCRAGGHSGQFPNAAARPKPWPRRLREANIGLILGGTTAGQANIFKEFPLSNGDKLRIATAPSQIGRRHALAHGVKPDIAVDASLADERAYLEDPYKIFIRRPRPE